MNKQYRLTKRRTVASPYDRTDRDHPLHSRRCPPRIPEVPIPAGQELRNGVILGSRNIPMEVLAQIFMAAVVQEYEADDAQERNSLCTMDAPMIFMAVCRSWKTITTLNPHLFCFIRLSLNIPDALAKKQERRLKMWLGRSGGLMLSVKIFGTTMPHLYSMTGQAQNFALQSVISHSQRWQNATVLIDGDLSDAPTSSSDLQWPWPALRSLRIGALQPHKVVANLILDGFEHAPELRTLDIGLQPSKVVLPWHRLTRISTHAESKLEECMGILVHCKALEEFEFKYSSSEHVHEYPKLPKLPNLRVLSLIVCDSTDLSAMQPSVPGFGGILKSLTAVPGLVDFRLHSFTQWYQYEVVAFLSRVSRTLRRLEFRCDLLTDYDLSQCLREVPSLHHLSLAETAQPRPYEEPVYCITVSNELLQRLTYGTGPINGLLSSLRSLEIEGSHFTTAFFVNMVQSRWILPEGVHGSRLETVTLKLLKPSAARYPGHEEEISRLKKLGIPVQVVDLQSKFAGRHWKAGNWV